MGKYTPGIWLRKFNHPYNVFNEHTHGLVYNQCNLATFNEYGAIHEAIADITGTCVEFYHNNISANWLAGEDYYSGGIRDLSNPKSTSISGPQQPDTYFGEFWYKQSYDVGGVHINNGVGNYWFYLLTNGGNDINDYYTSYNFNGIGIDKASNILL